MKFATKLSLGCIALLSCALGAAGLLLTGQSFSGSLASTRTALQAQQGKEKYALERIVFQATESEVMVRLLTPKRSTKSLTLHFSCIYNSSNISAWRRSALDTLSPLFCSFFPCSSS